MKKYSFFMLAMFAFALFFSSCQETVLDDIIKPNDSQEPTQKPNDPNSGGGVPSDSVFSVKMSATMEVGKMVYDSVVANVKLTYWDEKDVAHNTSLVISPSNNKIYLNKKHKKFQFDFVKWGVNQQLTFTKGQIKEGDTIRFNGKVNPKVLKSEEAYIQKGGVYEPESKNEYIYNPDGTVKQINYFRVDTKSRVMTFTSKRIYSYSAGLLKKVELFDDKGEVIGTSTLNHNTQGRVQQILEKMYGQQTDVFFKYEKKPDNSEKVSAVYSFDNGSKMNYSFTYKNGNIIEDFAGANGSTEGGKYEYDSNINPYAQMNIYSIFLTNLSKNNKIVEQKQYAGSVPSTVLYKTEYTYDTSGYPTELLQSYKGYNSNTHLFNVKTVLKY